MTATRALFACAFTMGIVAALPAPTLACTCFEIPPAEAYARADAAFAGLASDTQRASPVENLGPGPASMSVVAGAHVTRFLVEEAFLGVDGKEVLVFHAPEEVTNAA